VLVRLQVVETRDEVSDEQNVRLGNNLINSRKFSET